MTSRFKHTTILALLALALVGCGTGANAPTPPPTSTPSSQQAASPTAQMESEEQSTPEASPATRPTAGIQPNGDPLNPIDRLPDGTKIPIVPGQTVVVPEVTDCTPTRADAEGPFYEPNAPERTSVGKGHILRGVVRSSVDCGPLPGARLEFWQVNEQAEYDDDHRATLYAGAAGSYSFESNFPSGYNGMPPQIHLRVEAEGYQTLITQFYPREGETEATFDIVLVKQ